MSIALYLLIDQLQLQQKCTTNTTLTELTNTRQARTFSLSIFLDIKLNILVDVDSMSLHQKIWF
jgi:hypothetical protein